MKKSKIGIIVTIALLLVVLLCVSFPRVLSVETVTFCAGSESGNSKLVQAYQMLQKETGSYLETGNEVYLVTVGNLWERCVYEILPCYTATMDNIPANGIATWSTALYMVTTCINDNSLVSRMYNFQVRNLSVKLAADQSSYLPVNVYVAPGNFSYEMERDSVIALSQTFKCKNSPVVRIGLQVATPAQAQKGDLKRNGSYMWSFDLYGMGIKLCSVQSMELGCEYLSGCE